MLNAVKVNLARQIDNFDTQNKNIFRQRTVLDIILKAKSDKIVHEIVKTYYNPFPLSHFLI